MSAESAKDYEVKGITEVTPIEALALGATIVKDVGFVLTLPDTITDEDGLEAWGTQEVRDFIFSCLIESAFQNIVGGTIKVTRNEDGKWVLRVDKLSAFIEAFTDIDGFEKRTKEIKKSDENVIAVHVEDSYFWDIVVKNLKGLEINDTTFEGTPEEKRKIIIDAISKFRKAGKLEELSIVFSSSDNQAVSADKMLRRYAQKVENSKSKQ